MGLLADAPEQCMAASLREIMTISTKPCFLPHPHDSRVVHVFWAWERLQGPVEEAVKEDEACTAGPNHQDEDERNTKVVDHLQSKGRSSSSQYPGLPTRRPYSHTGQTWQLPSAKPGVGVATRRNGPSK